MAGMRAAIETGSLAEFAAAFENTDETDPTRASLDIA
jgi:hypothetical protein